MTRSSVRSLAAAGAILALAAAAQAREERREPPPAAIAARGADSQRLALRRPAPGLSRGPGGTSSIWGPTAGLALAVAVAGWAGWAARRAKGAAGRESALVQVIGRTHLSPKHAVYLLRAGDRVLIVGAGAGGSPTLLGEIPDRRPGAGGVA
jgi:hypothetical protein